MTVTATHSKACRGIVLLILAAFNIIAAAAPDRSYDIAYTIEFAKGDEMATASIQLTDGAENMRQLRFHIDPERHTDFSGDGQVTLQDDDVIWDPPAAGGTFAYQVRVRQKRRNGNFDAYATDDWALFRAGDIFPPATTRTLKGARSNSSLRLALPEDWSAVTQYRSAGKSDTFAFDNPARRFDRPTGWVLAGKIGVRRARIAGTRVAIASPVGEDFRRMDIMGFLNWTLSGLRSVFPTLDERLVIIGAGDPMWRGGLSGPGSLYLHSDRPLISENGTSTLLHELVHVAMGISGAGHDDWLVEGMAEYYSVKILQTSGTLSARRMDLTLDDLRRWGQDVDDLFVRKASGAITARAATILAELDAFLVQQASGGRGLDDVVAAMLEDDRPFSYRALCIAARAVMGGPVALLAPDRIPGAPADSECRATP